MNTAHERPSVTDDPEASLRHRLLELTPIAVAIGVLWIPWLTTGFWLDETGTYWVTDGTLSDTIERSRFQGQSPGYYVIVWITRQLVGDSEASLRLPSLLGMLAATVLVWRLTTILFASGALVSTATFAASSMISFASVDARPYGLAIAALAGATVCLVRWDVTGERRYGVGWILLTAAMLLLSYTFALAFVAHVAYLVWQSRRGGAIPLAVLCWASLAVLLLIAATLPHLRSLATTPGILRWRTDGLSYRRFAQTVLPPIVIGGLVLGTMIGRAAGPIRIRRLRLVPGVLLVALLALVPPVTTFLLSTISGKFFQTRYHIAASIGTALSLGWVASHLDPVRVRRAVAGAIVFLAILFPDRETPRRQDWQEAAAAVNGIVTDPRTPVLLHTGFASSRSGDAGEGAGLVRAPLAAYPMEGTIISVPFELDAGGEMQMRSILKQLGGADRFVLVQSFRVSPFREWIMDHVTGLRSRRILDERHIQIDLFERMP